MREHGEWSASERNGRTVFDWRLALAFAPKQDTMSLTLRIDSGEEKGERVS
jgi:hypothetical protein